MKKSIISLVLLIGLISISGATHQTAIANHFTEQRQISAERHSGLEAAQQSLASVMQNSVRSAPSIDLSTARTRNPDTVQSIISIPMGTKLTYYTDTDYELTGFWLDSAPILPDIGFVYYNPYNPLTGTSLPAYSEAGGKQIFHPRTIDIGNAPYHQELIDMLT